MTTIMTPISPGELLDKLTILEIKCQEISDPQKLANVKFERKELEVICEDHIPNRDDITSLKQTLLDVNKELWKIEDDIRDCERSKNFGDVFVQLARAVYVTNDKRAALKKDINLALGSKLVEEKSYSEY